MATASALPRDPTGLPMEARILQTLRPYLEAYALRAPGEIAVAEVRGAQPPRGRATDAVPAASS